MHTIPSWHNMSWTVNFAPWTDSGWNKTWSDPLGLASQLVFSLSWRPIKFCWQKKSNYWGPARTPGGGARTGIILWRTRDPRHETEEQGRAGQAVIIFPPHWPWQCPHNWYKRLWGARTEINLIFQTYNLQLSHLSQQTANSRKTLEE